MYGPLSYATWRDAIRRAITQVPPVDDGTGAAGAQPSRWPFPTNAALNQAIDETIAWVDQIAEPDGDAVVRTVPIPGQTNLGPFALLLRNIAPAGSILSVRKCSWSSDGTTSQPLTPADRQNLDADRRNWEGQSPGTPTLFWVESGRLMLWPAPSCTGFLVCQFGQSLFTWSADIDSQIIDVVPASYMPVLVHYSIPLALAGQPDDAVYAPIIAAYRQLVGDESTGETARLMRFFAMRNKSYQGRVQADVGRVGVWGGNRF